MKRTKFFIFCILIFVAQLSPGKVMYVGYCTLAFNVAIISVAANCSYLSANMQCFFNGMSWEFYRLLL